VLDRGVDDPVFHACCGLGECIGEGDVRDDAYGCARDAVEFAEAGGCRPVCDGCERGSFSRSGRANGLGAAVDRGSGCVGCGACRAENSPRGLPERPLGTECFL
jgi:hypothetical protein